MIENEEKNRLLVLKIMDKKIYPSIILRVILIIMKTILIIIIKKHSKFSEKSLTQSRNH